MLLVVETDVGCWKRMEPRNDTAFDITDLTSPKITVKRKVSQQM